jgi:N-acetylneuraminate lyase
VPLRPPLPLSPLSAPLSLSLCLTLAPLLHTRATSQLAGFFDALCLFPQYDLLYCRDEQLLAALALGARGAVGATFNFMAGPYQRMLEAFEGGDLQGARAEQARANSVSRLLGLGGSRYGSPGADVGKAIMRIKGAPIGMCRSPKPSVTDERALALLRADLDEVDFFSWCD